MLLSRAALGGVKRLMAEAVVKALPLDSRTFGPPRGYYRTAHEWADQFDGVVAGEKIKLVRPAAQFSRTAAKTLLANQPRSFREAIVESLPELNVAAIPHGRVAGAKATIISPDDRVLLDLSQFFGPYFDPIFYAWRLPDIKQVDGKVLVIATAPANAYFHWLLDALPRIALARECGVNVAEIAGVVVNDPSILFIAETLDLLGIDKNKRIAANDQLHLDSACLIVPAIPSSGNPAKWQIDFLRDSFLPQKSTGSFPSRIYVSRKNASYRKVINEEEVEALLVKHGFVSVKLEEMSFSDQVAMFNSISAVVAPHGGGLTNLAFCTEGTRVIEILSPTYPNICFWTLASQVGLDYYYVAGPGEFDYTCDMLKFMKVDIECDIKLLESTLKFAGLDYAEWDGN